MKKIISVVIVVAFVSIIFYERLTPVDVSQYQLTYKEVEVKGEVVHPGVYQVAIHATIQDVLEQAGGISEQGDTSALNLTEDVANHEVIVVAPVTEVMRISINSGTLEQLDSLPGIGPSIAQRIIDYRSARSFQTLEELKQVKGIGDKLYDKIVDSITL